VGSIEMALKPEIFTPAPPLYFRARLTVACSYVVLSNGSLFQPVNDRLVYGINPDFHVFLAENVALVTCTYNWGIDSPEKSRSWNPSFMAF
jgi:hypothetical protein